MRLKRALSRILFSYVGWIRLLELWPALLPASAHTSSSSNLIQPRRVPWKSKWKMLDVACHTMISVSFVCSPFCLLRICYFPGLPHSLQHILNVICVFAKYYEIQVDPFSWDFAFRIPLSFLFWLLCRRPNLEDFHFSEWLFGCWLNLRFLLL